MDSNSRHLESAASLADSSLLICIWYCLVRSSTVVAPWTSLMNLIDRRKSSVLSKEHINVHYFSFSSCSRFLQLEHWTSWLSFSNIMRSSHSFWASDFFLWKSSSNRAITMSSSSLCCFSSRLRMASSETFNSSLNRSFSSWAVDSLMSLI